MVQDPADRDGVGDVGNDLEGATAASADERIRLKDLGDEPRPAWGAAALLGLLLLVLLVYLASEPTVYAESSPVLPQRDRPFGDPAANSNAFLAVETIMKARNDA